MIALFSLLQEIDIEEKVKNAPNGDYEIGVLIGSFIPLVVLVIIAYALYRYNKKNNLKELNKED
ncbi:hypothetical protein BZARG_1115 [Bizionia argentinensis JUB59]|uniref:Uncharacterized protein n=1 Tax=Bizionia argentinensis JUB59 TaxID=1046627 RepID=G2EEL4_9FLAO|nr:hypothetical protein [Bizionia argentinensis]EGV43108.1 hypothetical protein BZARG_1115 [Bizionia argentinensis JUB59]